MACGVYYAGIYKDIYTCLLTLGWNVEIEPTFTSGSVKIILPGTSSASDTINLRFAQKNSIVLCNSM